MTDRPSNPESPPPRVMKWDHDVNGYVAVTDPDEARELAKRCIYPIEPRPPHPK